MKYNNLTFFFQNAGPGKLSLRLSGAGEATESIDRARLAELLPNGSTAGPAANSDGELRDFGKTHRNSLPDRPEEVGRQLFDTLFVGQIRELLCSQLGAVNRGEHYLRLRLALDINSPSLRSLQQLPWELLWYSGWGTFLGLDRRFSLVRSLDVPRPSIDIPAVEKLKILVATASPEGLAPLDLEGEVERIQEALRGQDRIGATFLPSATFQSLRDRLLDPPAQILHFAGHGYDEDGLGLVLEDKWKGPYNCEASRWAEQVSDLPLRLVVLNACSTAVPSSLSSQPFHGVAQALIRAGLSAVVAMRNPILDSSGLTFAKIFYARLAAGDPIDAALVEVRKALRAQLPDRPDWAIPALFLGGEDGQLFAPPRPDVNDGASTSARKLEGYAEVETLGDTTEVAGVNLVGVTATEREQSGRVKVGVAGSGNKIYGYSRRA